jgi:beta-lactamase class A
MLVVGASLVGMVALGLGAYQLWQNAWVSQPSPDPMQPHAAVQSTIQPTIITTVGDTTLPSDTFPSRDVLPHQASPLLLEATTTFSIEHALVSRLGHSDETLLGYTQRSLTRLGWEAGVFQSTSQRPTTMFTMLPSWLHQAMPQWLAVPSGWRFAEKTPVVPAMDFPIYAQALSPYGLHRYQVSAKMRHTLQSQYRLPFIAPVFTPYMDEVLAKKLERLLSRADASLKPHVYLYHPGRNQHVSIGGEVPVSSASVIKLPILYMLALRFPEAFTPAETTYPQTSSTLSAQTEFQAKYPQLFTDTLRAGGSGRLNFMPAGDSYDLYHVAKYMIQSSDNSCTNMAIQALGGLPIVYGLFETMGFQATQLRDWLPDLAGHNTLSPHDMVSLLHHLYTTDTVSPAVKKTLLNILKGTLNRSLITGKLPSETVFYHKTGDIGTALGDAGLLVLPNGQEVYIAVQVERPFNAPQARPLIQAIGHTVYTHYLAL